MYLILSMSYKQTTSRIDLILCKLNEHFMENTHHIYIKNEHENFTYEYEWNVDDFACYDISSIFSYATGVPSSYKLFVLEFSSYLTQKSLFIRHHS